MRVTTAFKRLLDLPGSTVTEVGFEPAEVVVTVKLRSRRLHCPACSFSTKARYDLRPVASSWRHLDLGRWRLRVHAKLRRLDCPTHGVRTEAVPFARAGSRFTADFKDLTGWLATTMDKTALTRLVRIDWDTVGMLLDRFCSRAQRSGLSPFVTLAKTIRKRREGILAAVRLGVNNARHEGLNRRVRLIVNRAYGFHSASAALGLIMLTFGPIQHVLPHEHAASDP